MVRNAIPWFAALFSVFLVKLIDVEMNGLDHVIHTSNGDRIAEVSDVIGGILLLLSFHLLDRLLEKYWATDPYRDSHSYEPFPLTNTTTPMNG